MSDTTCPYCGGSGREDDGEVCLACNGSGWYGTSKQLTDKIQSLEQEVARLREENLAMRNWRNCKEPDSCNKPVVFCPCDKWELKRRTLIHFSIKKSKT